MIKTIDKLGLGLFEPRGKFVNSIELGLYIR